MEIHHHINHFSAKNSIITIGTFDGVHLGHQMLIRQMNSLAKNVNGQSVIFTFYPHPRLVLSNRHQNLRLITTLDEKIQQLEKAGVDHLIVFPFDKQFSELTYTDFIENILLKKLNLHTLFVGYDHKLGRNREGTYQNILALANKKQFNVEKTDTFSLNNEKISSSKIRTALQNGDIEKANQYLGYTFQIKGRVARGNQIGQKLGYPTANIEANDIHKLIPQMGVYAASATINNTSYNGMLNIGYRPTINTNADKRTIEMHLFNFENNLYQKDITVFLHKKIRNEKKFANLDELKNQLKTDEEQIKNILQ